MNDRCKRTCVPHFVVYIDHTLIIFKLYIWRRKQENNKYYQMAISNPLPLHTVRYNIPVKQISDLLRIIKNKFILSYTPIPISFLFIVNVTFCFIKDTLSEEWRGDEKPVLEVNSLWGSLTTIDWRKARICARKIQSFRRSHVNAGVSICLHVCNLWCPRDFQRI